MVNLLICHYRKFKNAGHSNNVFFPRIYLHYLFLRIRYRLGISDYFDNQLWD